MKLFDILNIQLPSLKPAKCKIHLAVWNGKEDPLDVFLSDKDGKKFHDWQNWQSNRNFERPFIVSLIKLDNFSRWLFAGVYASQGCNFHEDRNAYRYQSQELSEVSELTGRLILKFKRPGRQSYLRAEKWVEGFLVEELRSQRLTVAEFPGYANVIISKSTLDIIVKQQIESWKSALSNVAGVYLITDTENGRHYVGSAYGQGGIWQRWNEYSENGHGNNKRLKELLEEKGFGYSSKFQFSILEIADTHASQDDVLAREQYWKNALCSRAIQGGYNEN